MHNQRYIKFSLGATMGYLVLFGAGASYGNATEHTPPLGDKLFEKLEALQGVSHSLPDNIKIKFKSNFEEGMAELCLKIPDAIMPFQRELANYLSKFSPQHDSNYVNLLRSIKTHRFKFSSLNYDLLFELSASIVGLETVYSKTNRKGAVNLLKIHGSCNFWPTAADIMRGKVQIMNLHPEGADVISPIRIMGQEQTIRNTHGPDGLSPAMAVYAKGKKVRICPDFVQEQQKQWEHLVSTSSKIFIIGVRIHLPDKHIWEPIANSTASVHYFGGDNDQADFNLWASEYNRVNCYFRKAYFNESIDIIRKLTK